MDIVVYRSGKRWAQAAEEAFAAGLARHGIAAEQRAAGDRRASDLAVIWAHRDEALFALQRAAGGHYLVMERGYIGDLAMRRAWVSLGLDGLNGRARFPAAPDGQRWERNFAGRLRGWRGGPAIARHGAIAVMGQVAGDASLRGRDLAGWYGAAAEFCRAQGWRPVLRPHPQCPGIGAGLDVEIDRGPLAALLGRVDYALTWNSNSAVDAILAGVPASAMDEGSMAWPVAAHGLVLHFRRPDREAWAAQLAWCQWTPAEIAAGEAWPHLAALI